MMTRILRGVTIVELMIAVAIGTLLLITGYNALIFMKTSQVKTETASTRTITQIQLMEKLTQDIRSGYFVPEDATEYTPPYTIMRHVASAGGVDVHRVEWSVSTDGMTVTREDHTSGENKEFRFENLLEANEIPLLFQVEKVPEAEFFVTPD